MNKTSFDYLIIGGGLAGLQLALALIDDPFFSKKKIGIIEPSTKESNDKTWCYWERGNGKWDEIIHHQWKSGQVITESDKSIHLEMQDYSYKMIRSLDFYKYAKRKINNSLQIEWITDKIEELKNNTAIGAQNSYQGNVIFDSRIAPDFFKDEKSIKLIQHFKGWTIKSKTDLFNPKQFAMMDFGTGYQDSCCFTYLLPLSTKEALVEFTFFTPELVEDKVYDRLLSQYLHNRYPSAEYEVVEEEQGQIPMSTYPFHQSNHNNYLKIGTAGGWVKASSGYSFKNTERKIDQLIQNLKTNASLEQNLRKPRHEFYDRIFLRVLKDENHLGNQLFQQMYGKNSATSIFNFLDEESNLLEELKIINNFEKAPFLRSLKKDLTKTN